MNKTIFAEINSYNFASLVEAASFEGVGLNIPKSVFKG